MQFTGLQIRAIFSMAQALIAADGKFQENETLPLVMFSTLLGLKENEIETFAKNPVEPQSAIAIVSEMTSEQKKEVKDLLVAIMDADGERHPEERKLIALLSLMCNLPFMK